MVKKRKKKIKKIGDTHFFNPPDQSSSMEDKDLNDFRQVGKITARIRDESKSLIMIGEPLLEIAETIEEMIKNEGIQPAFPVNISLNEIAAHYTPEFDDKTTLGEKDLVKIDIGGLLNGAIADTAYTIALSSEHDKLVEASQEALKKALDTIRPGVTIGEIGGVVEDTTKSYGFKPISNLSGHMIQKNNLHAGITVPNVRTTDPYEFREGEVYAIEPFVTTGTGYVEDTERVEIFSLYSPSPIRMRHTRQVLKYILETFGPNPFAERWVRKKFSSKMLVSASLREMLERQVVQGYAVLKEAENGLVAQSEHTILVTEKGCEILTKA